MIIMGFHLDPIHLSGSNEGKQKGLFFIQLTMTELYTMVFLKKSQLSILKIPHFHVSSVDFVDCLFTTCGGKGT